MLLFGGGPLGVALAAPGGPGTGEGGVGAPDFLIFSGGLELTSDGAGLATYGGTIGTGTGPGAPDFLLFSGGASSISPWLAVPGCVSIMAGATYL